MEGPSRRQFPSSIALVLIIAVVAVVLAPVTGLFFFSDDYCWLTAAEQAERRPGLDLPEDINGHFRPLAEAYWLIAHRISGLDPRGYHLLTLALHLLTTLAVAILCGRLFEDRRAVAIGGLCFGVNFAHRTVPTWISAAPDLLLGLCVASGLAALAGRRPRPMLGSIGIGLALLAKESALVVVSALPLLAPFFCRRGRSRWVLAAISTALLVPHGMALCLSTYVGGRFSLGGHIAGNLLASVSALLVPWVSGGVDILAERSTVRMAIGWLVLSIVVIAAGRRVGWRMAGGWLAAVVLTLFLPALAEGPLEPRWLYLPWVVLSPLVAAAGLSLLDDLSSRRGPRLARVVLAFLLLAQVVVHGGLLRAKIRRDVERDAWCRNLLEVARRPAREVRDGDLVEVIVPTGTDLRYWPLGVRLWVARDVRVQAVGSAGVRPTELVLDGTARPIAWR